jgi:hypothetical protein
MAEQSIIVGSSLYSHSSDNNTENTSVAKQWVFSIVAYSLERGY